MDLKVPADQRHQHHEEQAPPKGKTARQITKKWYSVILRNARPIDSEAIFLPSCPVAPIFFAAAYDGVVLLADGLVALSIRVLVVHVAAGANHRLLAEHCARQYVQ